MGGMMSMSDIANNAKITLIWRVGLGLCSILGTLGVAGIFGYVRSADSKLTQTRDDVAQIKWELPVIKENVKQDKEAILKTINNLEDRVQSMRSLTDSDRREISDLKTTIAVMKHKLQLQ